MYFYDPKSREYKELAAGIHGRTFWGSNLLMAVVDLEANAILPSHTHPHEQGGIVLSGEVELTIDRETRNLSPGDIYIIPGGVEHSAKTGSRPAQLLDIFAPAREDLKY